METAKGYIVVIKRPALYTEKNKKRIIDAV